jgi:hypothetical protein
VATTSDEFAVIAGLKSRGFICLSILREKDSSRGDNSYTILLKVGPKLFPKLAVGLNLPLQPTDMYSQGDLYRIYEAAMVSVYRFRKIDVIRCFLQHDKPALRQCLRTEKTTDLISYFGLEFGLLIDFVKSYRQKLVPVALIALALECIFIYQYATYNICSGARFHIFFPALVTFWSVVNLTFWRQRAMALICGAYSGLMLALVRGSTASLLSIHVVKLLTLICCTVAVTGMAMLYVAAQDNLKTYFGVKYVLAVLYSITPPLLSMAMISVMADKKEKVISKQGESIPTETAKMPNGGSTTATSGLFALEIINYHGGLFYLHFIQNDFEGVQLLLICKLLCEQAIDILRYHYIKSAVGKKRQESLLNYKMVPVDSSQAQPSPRRRSETVERLGSHSKSNEEMDRIRSQNSAYSGSPAQKDVTIDHRSRSVHPSDKRRKISRTRKLINKLTGKKGEPPVPDDQSDFTEATELHDQPDFIDYSMTAPVARGMSIDVSPRADAAHNHSPRASRIGTKGPDASVSYLMDEFMEHPTYDDFNLTRAYSRILVLHGYLVLFASIHPLSVILIFLQLGYIIKMNLVEASNSLRSNCYANRMLSKEADVPQSLRKRIEIAKQQDAPNPSLTVKSITRDSLGRENVEDEQDGTKFAENMMASAAYSIRSDALFCFYVNVSESSF